MYIDTDIGNQLREARLKLKYNINYLTTKHGINHATVINYEDGRIGTSCVLLKFMKIYNMDYKPYFREHEQDLKVIIDDAGNIYNKKQINEILNLKGGQNFDALYERRDEILHKIKYGKDKAFLTDNYINYLNRLKNRTYADIYGTKRRGIF